MAVAKMAMAGRFATRALVRLSHIASKLPWNRKGLVYRLARHIELTLRDWFAPTAFVPIVTRDGLTMYLCPVRDDVSEILLGKRVFESATTDVFKRHLSKGMVVADVGAHIGYYSLLAARLVGDEGRVFAFEPMPAAFQLLNRNIEANGFKNVILVQKAVWSEAGIATFTARPDSLGESSLGDRGFGKRVEVETIRLDDFFADHERRVDFIKMDVEGAEFAALDGMRRILKTNSGLTLVTEFNPPAIRAMGASAQAFLEKLSHAYGFAVEAVLDGDDVKGIDFLDHMPEGRIVNLLLTRGRQ